MEGITKEAAERILITVPRNLLNSVDELVKQGVFQSRSEAIRTAMWLLVQMHGDTMSLVGGPREVTTHTHITHSTVKKRSQHTSQSRDSQNNMGDQQWLQSIT
jgi:metal-responsive CopG/Arc/MetJ family transcriptional regulator